MEGMRWLIVAVVIIFAAVAVKVTVAPGYTLIGPKGSCNMTIGKFASGDHFRDTDGVTWTCRDGVWHARHVQ